MLTDSARTRFRAAWRIAREIRTVDAATSPPAEYPTLEWTARQPAHHFMLPQACAALETRIKAAFNCRFSGRILQMRAYAHRIEGRSW